MAEPKKAQIIGNVSSPCVLADRSVLYPSVKILMTSSFLWDPNDILLAKRGPSFCKQWECVSKLTLEPQNLQCRIALICSYMGQTSSIFSTDFWFLETISYLLQHLLHFHLSYLLLSFLLGLMETSILLEEIANKNDPAWCFD